MRLGLWALVAAALNSVVPAPDPCAARATSTLQWIAAPASDAEEIDRWCHAVGPPLLIPDPLDGAWGGPASGRDSPPPLDELVVVTWNAHMADGRLGDLVRALRAGRLTNGRPIDHFVLLVQEMFRRGDAVPAFPAGGRSAFGIRSRDPQAPDIADHARALGLAALYVPSMRNGEAVREDRGNAIFSTEPLSKTFAIELPLARQRRVAIGAEVAVVCDGRPGTLQVIDVHLEPLSAPRSLWVFRNPRRRQIGAILDLLDRSSAEDDATWSGTLLGGDFNTVQAGVDEDTYKAARAWSTGLVGEDRRLTHLLGRIDYVFFRLPAGWGATATRLDEKFGSDHYPVLGRLQRVTEQ